MNLLDMLKQANIFSPTGQDNNQQFPVGSIGGPQVDPSVSQSPLQQQGGGMDINAAIQSMLNPRDEQFQNYAQLIQSMPQRSQFPEPGLWTKIRAHLAGMGANNSEQAGQVREGIENDKYYEALSDWNAQLKPRQEISQMEQTRNVGNRATALG